MTDVERYLHDDICKEEVLSSLIDDRFEEYAFATSSEVVEQVNDQSISACIQAGEYSWQACRRYLLYLAQRQGIPNAGRTMSMSDIVHDALVEAQRGVSQFRGTSEIEFRAWLKQILLNNIANLRRHYFEVEKRRITREVQLDDSTAGQAKHVLLDPGSSPSHRAARNEKLELLAAAMAKLSAKDRQVLELRYFKGLTYAEIGEQMQLTADAARMQLARAAKRIAKKVEVLRDE